MKKIYGDEDYTILELFLQHMETGKNDTDRLVTVEAVGYLEDLIERYNASGKAEKESWKRLTKVALEARGR